jgi:cold-inducible RNA-binding protein
MSTKLYVGNLPFKASEEELNTLFSSHGNVTDVFIVKDKFSGRSKGFAFVTLDTPESAQSAIEQLNDFEFLGRNLVVNEARPKEERPRRNDRNFSNDRSNKRY